MVGKISFVGVKTEFEPVPSGVYESVFSSYKFGKTKEKQEDKVDLQFSVDEEGDWHNRKTFRTCTFNADSLWAFKRTMIALGADVNWEDPEGIDPEAICRSVFKNKCIVKVFLDPEGFTDPVTGAKRPSNRVDDVLPTDAMKLQIAEAAQQVPQPDFAAEAVDETPSRKR